MRKQEKTLTSLVWPAIQDHLEKKYKILAKLAIAELDRKPALYYSKLKSICKSEYLPNEKILVYHYDTDYYVNQTNGLALTNFLQCLKALDISPSVVILLTNHYGISQEIENFYKKNYHNFDYNNDYITVFENNYQMLQSSPSIKNTDIDMDKIVKHFICLTGVARPSRIFFLCGLKDNNLLDHGICSWHFDDPPALLPSAVSAEPEFTEGCPRFVMPVPFTRMCEDWVPDHYFDQIYRTHNNQFVGNYKDLTITSGRNKHRFNLPAIKKSFLYVSIETAFCYPYPYLTEKTYKAIIMKRPFIIVGAPGSINQLHQLGFKTFGRFWDEGYDNITDPNCRLFATLKIVKDVCSMSIDQVKELCYSMQEILEYNVDHYIQNYSQRDLITKLPYL